MEARLEAGDDVERVADADRRVVEREADGAHRGQQCDLAQRVGGDADDAREDVDERERGHRLDGGDGARARDARVQQAEAAQARQARELGERSVVDVVRVLERHARQPRAAARDVREARVGDLGQRVVAVAADLQRLQQRARRSHREDARVRRRQRHAASGRRRVPGRDQIRPHPADTRHGVEDGQMPQTRTAPSERTQKTIRHKRPCGAQR